MKNKFHFFIIASALLGLSCLEEKPNKTETIFLASVPEEELYGFDYTPVEFINHPADSNLFFSSLNEDNDLKEALTYAFNSMYLSNERFLFTIDALKNIESDGHLSSQAIMDEFFNANIIDLKIKYDLLLLLGHICGESAIDELVYILEQPVYETDEEHAETETMIKMAAGRNLVRIYASRNSYDAEYAIQYILGNNDVNESAQIEIISQLKHLTLWSDQDIENLLSNNELINLEFLEEYPTEDDTVDPEPETDTEEEYELIDGEE